MELGQLMTTDSQINGDLGVFVAYFLLPTAYYFISPLCLPYLLYWAMMVLVIS